MSHTPTPWTVVQPSQDTDYVIEIRSSATEWTVARMGDGDLIDEQDHDNAAHIIRCVNTYPQLVEALKAMHEILSDLLEDPHAEMTTQRYAALQAIDKSNQALAAAEKGS